MSRAGDRRGGAVRAAQSLSACSSLAVGVFGWLIAHLLTLLLLAHSHGGTLSRAVQGLHGYTTAATVLVGGVAVLSLLVMPVSASSPGPSRPGPPRRAGVLGRSAAMSTLAFVVAQLAEHTLLDGFRMPPAILLAGVLMHALFGAVSALTWHHYHELVHRLWPPNPRIAGTSPAPLLNTRMSVQEPRRPVFDSCVAGRAPPITVAA